MSALHALRGALLAIGLLSFSICHADDVPNPMTTPGSVRPGLTKDQICTIKWGQDERHVTEEMKQEVFKLYGYSGNDDPHCVPAGKRQCEIDHLVSRELGGADEVKNLWPQAYGSRPWNAVLKDRLENRLHQEVCASRLSLDDARAMIAKDWREAYKKYFGVPK
jgi:hypothetical protein